MADRLNIPLPEETVPSPEPISEDTSRYIDQHGQVAVTTPLGRSATLPQDKVDAYLQMGYKLQPKAEAEERAFQAAYGDNTAEAAGLGLLRGATGSISDILLGDTGIVSKERLREVKERQPVTSTLTDIAGTIVGPGKLIGAGGRLVEKGVERAAVGLGAEAAGLGTKVLSKAAGFGAEGVAFSSIGVADQVYLAKDPMSNEQVAAMVFDQLPKGFLFGAAIGAAVPVLGKALNKVLAPARREAEKITEAMKLELGESTATSARNVPEYATNLETPVAPGSFKIADRLSESHGAEYANRADRTDMAEAVQKHMNAVSKRGGHAQAETEQLLDDLAKEAPANLNPAQRLDFIRRRMRVESTAEAANTPEFQAATAKANEEIAALNKKFYAATEAPPRGQTGDMHAVGDVSESGRFVETPKPAEPVAVRGTPLEPKTSRFTPEEQGTHDAYIEHLKANPPRGPQAVPDYLVPPKVPAPIGEVPLPELMQRVNMGEPAAIEEYTSRFGRPPRAERPASKAPPIADTSGFDPMKAEVEFSMQRGPLAPKAEPPGALQKMLGGLPGQVAGSLLRRVATKAVGRHLMAGALGMAAAGPAGAIVSTGIEMAGSALWRAARKGVADMRGKISDVAERISEPVARKSVAPSAVVIGTHIMGGDERQPLPATIAKYRKEATKMWGPAGDERARTLVSPISLMNPDMGNEISDTIQRRNAFLASKMPSSDPEVMPLGGSRKLVSEEAAAKFAKYVAGAHVGASIILDQLDAGKIPDREVLQAVAALQPKTYGEIRLAVMNAIVEKGDVPYEKRVALSVLFQTPLDPTMQPSFIAFAQQNATALEAENIGSGGGAPQSRTELGQFGRNLAGEKTAAQGAMERA